MTDASTGPVDPLDLRPELQQRYTAFLTTLWQEGAVPPRTLELCRLRIAAIHGCAASWWPASPPADLLAVSLSDTERAALVQGLTRANHALFSDAEIAALTVAEQIPHAHHAIDDAQIEALRGAYGDRGAVGLLTAVAFMDVNARLRVALGVTADAGGTAPS